jgi:hypothetical protein
LDDSRHGSHLRDLETQAARPENRSIYLTM